MRRSVARGRIILWGGLERIYYGAGWSVREWEKAYDSVRPYQALGYLTPQEYVTQWQNYQARKEAL